MKKLLALVVICLFLAVPAAAAEITAPTVPQSGRAVMPKNTESFGDALMQLIENSIDATLPDIKEAVRICLWILIIALLFSIVAVLPNQSGNIFSIVSAVAVFLMMFQNTEALIRLASDAVYEICEYGRLLCPVMTAALAAQGAVASSSSLYTGTSLFTALLGTLISKYFIPMVYAFLIFSTANSALGEDYMRKLADSIKGVLSWLLKTVMMIFTTYMSITGVISGTTDAVALKAAKVTISTAVPVVGSILSDASEAVLVSVGVMKNAAGIYGILAALAVFIGPFLKVGLQYLGLKLSASLCCIFAGKSICSQINDLATAMGLLLAMLASVCIMILISTVCFLKGAS